MSYQQYLKVQDTKNGKCLFTTVKIPADTAIMELTGPIVLDRELPADSDASHHYLQIGPNTYLGPSGGIGDALNHHCQPNAKIHCVGNRAILYSVYVIPADSEICVDYATTSTETKEQWQMACHCGSYSCRMVVSGFQYLDEKTKQHYEDQGMLPLYILMPDLIQKR
jgi:hypothetical protein